MRPEIINARLLDDYYFLEDEGYEVFGVFLFGSQNYNCDIETSDIDVKAIVVPSLDNLIFRKSEISKTYQRENGELTVFDIQNMFYNFKKQNVNFLEILFTNFGVINSKYKQEYSIIHENREKIAHLNFVANMNCICGCAKNKSKKVFKEMPSNKEAINRYGYDNKALADILRYEDMAVRYYTGEPYEKCLVPPISYHIRKLKEDGTMFTPETAKVIHDNSIQHIDLILKGVDSMEMNIDKESIEILDNVCRSVIKTYIVEQLEDNI